MLKKSFILIILMLFIITTAVYGTGNKFTDVGDYWATDAIKWAAELGVVEGFPDGTFKPTQDVKEGEFAAILARYVINTDKVKISQKQEGKHWSQSIYDELSQWELPLLGYDNDKVKEKSITRGQVARVVAAKNGFNLDEKQAVYYMYENDLSSGMIPGRLTFESYGVDKPLQRDQITQFIKSLNEKGITTFMGQPSAKGNADPTDILGIEDILKENIEITDEMFDELAKKKGIENPKKNDNTILIKLEDARNREYVLEPRLVAIVGGVLTPVTPGMTEANTEYGDIITTLLATPDSNVGFRDKDLFIKLIEENWKDTYLNNFQIKHMKEFIDEFYDIPGWIDGNELYVVGEKYGVLLDKTMIGEIGISVINLSDVGAITRVKIVRP